MLLESRTSGILRARLESRTTLEPCRTAAPSLSGLAGVMERNVGNYAIRVVVVETRLERLVVGEAKGLRAENRELRGTFTAKRSGRLGLVC